MMTHLVHRKHPDPISSHVLDTTAGVPGRDIAVTLFRRDHVIGKDDGSDAVWTRLSSR